MIAEALAAACAEPAVLARLGGPLGAAARAASARLAAAGPGRRALRAAWAAAARAPVPPGLRGAHPSWIEAALAELPPRARVDLAAGGWSADGAPRGEGGAVAVWLARWACAELPPLPAARAPGGGPPAALAEAVALGGAELARWLAEIGADQLALAVGAAGPAALASAARVVGPALDRAAARVADPPRAGALGPQRAALARCAGGLAAGALAVIGARALAPHTDALSRRQLAVRLPLPLGRAVAAALAAHAADPRVEAPRWEALGAAW